MKKEMQKDSYHPALVDQESIQNFSNNDFRVAAD